MHNLKICITYVWATHNPGNPVSVQLGFSKKLGLFTGQHPRIEAEIWYMDRDTDKE